MLRNCSLRKMLLCFNNKIFNFKGRGFSCFPNGLFLCFVFFLLVRERCYLCPWRSLYTKVTNYKTDIWIFLFFLKKNSPLVDLPTDPIQDQPDSRTVFYFQKLGLEKGENRLSVIFLSFLILIFLFLLQFIISYFIFYGLIHL